MSIITYLPAARGLQDDRHTTDCGCRSLTLIEGLCPAHWLAGWPTVDELLAHDHRSTEQRRKARIVGYDRAALLAEAAKTQPACMRCGLPATVRGQQGCYCAGCFPRAELS